MDSLLDIVARVKRACLPPRAEIGSLPHRDRSSSAPRSVRFHWRHTRAGRPGSDRCTHQARELDGAALIHRAAPLGHGIRPGAASRSYLRHLGRTLKVRPRRPRYDRASLRASARARPSGTAGTCGRARRPGARLEQNVNVPSQRERTFLPSFWGQTSEGWEKGTFTRRTSVDVGARRPPYSARAFRPQRPRHLAARTVRDRGLVAVVAVGADREVAWAGLRMEEEGFRGTSAVFRWNSKDLRALGNCGVMRRARVRPGAPLPSHVQPAPPAGPPRAADTDPGSQQLPQQGPAPVTIDSPKRTLTEK